MECVGIDVAKRELVCFFEGRTRQFDNSEQGIANLLCEYKDVPLAMEATGRFHEPLAKAAHASGALVYVCNPARVKKYRDYQVCSRGKTDLLDARLLAGYAEDSMKDLRPYQPLSQHQEELRSLHSRRRLLSRTKANLAQALEGPEDQVVISAIQARIKSIDKAIERLCKDSQDAQRLASLPGVGPVVSSALALALARGEFSTSDAFVAYAGLDPRPNDSGQRTGKRSLTHRGDSELRRLLYLAAMVAARHNEHFKAAYSAQARKHLAPTQIYVILARKLARIAWTIYKRKEFYKTPIDNAT